MNRKDYSMWKREVIEPIAISLPFVIIVGFIGASIFANVVGNKKVELMKSESCYVEYRLNERSGETWIYKDYCGGSSDESE